MCKLTISPSACQCCGHTVIVALVSKENLMSFHKTQVLGNLGTDPELRHSSKPRATFSVAVNDRWTSGDGQPQEHTEWYVRR